MTKVKHAVIHAPVIGGKAVIENGHYSYVPSLNYTKAQSAHAYKLAHVHELVERSLDNRNYFMQIVLPATAASMGCDESKKVFNR